MGWKSLPEARRDAADRPCDIVRWPVPHLMMDLVLARDGHATPPDDDNLIAATKSLRDGIADAGIVTDDRFIHVGTVRYQSRDRSLLDLKHDGMLVILRLPTWHEVAALGLPQGIPTATGFTVWEGR